MQQFKAFFDWETILDTITLVLGFAAIIGACYAVAPY
jgi:hypothetical protein